MKNILWLTLNTLKVVFRRKSNLFVFFVLPCLALLLVLGIYGRNDNSAINIGMLDKDRSNLTQEFVKSLGSEDKFKVITVNNDDYKKKLTSGAVDCVLMIPQGFGDSIYKENPLKIRDISIKGQTATTMVDNYSSLYFGDLMDVSKASNGDRNVFDKIYGIMKQQEIPLTASVVKDQSKGKVMTVQSIGFLIMFMMMGAGTLAELITKEKKERTYFRICSSPVSSKAYVAANVLSNMVMIMLQVMLLLVIMTKVLHFETYIPVWELFCILMVFGLVTIGLGLLVVAFSNDSSQSNALLLLIVNPTCLIAGCYFPVDLMPKSLQKIADFMPQRWVLSAIQKLQAGGGIGDIAANIGIILAFAMTFFVVAVYKFSKNNDIRIFV